MISSNFLYHWYYRNAFRSAGILWLIYTMINFLNAGDVCIHINDPYSISQKLLSLFLLVVQSAAILASFEVKYSDLPAFLLCQVLLAGLNVVIGLLWPYTWFQTFYQQIPMVIIPLTIGILMLWKIKHWLEHVVEAFSMYTKDFYAECSCVGIKSIDDILEAEQVDLVALLQELFIIREANQDNGVKMSEVIDRVCLELIKRRDRLTVSVKFLRHEYDPCDRYLVILTITKILCQVEHVDLDRQMLTLLGILLRISFQKFKKLRELKACKVPQDTKLTTEQMETLLLDFDKVPKKEDYMGILNIFAPAKTCVKLSRDNKLILVVSCC